MMIGRIQLGGAAMVCVLQLRMNMAAEQDLPDSISLNFYAC